MKHREMIADCLGMSPGTRKRFRCPISLGEETATTIEKMISRELNEANEGERFNVYRDGKSAFVVVRYKPMPEGVEHVETPTRSDPRREPRVNRRVKQ
jgi:hypothetical protein